MKKHYRKEIYFGFAIVTGIAVLAIVLLTSKKVQEKPFPEKAAEPEIKTTPFTPGNTNLPPAWHFQPGPISMNVLKKQGCVADGLLSGYGKDTNKEVAMINRSNCLYLHRALETWGNPPDFKQALEIMPKITKPGIIYGMFISEDISTSAEADNFYAEDSQAFNFSAMCKDGTQNKWGERTCIPDFDRKEYRNYLSYITHRAMDLGIQSFLFGQIYYQEGRDDKLAEILADMRDYARVKNMQIVIGAQTGPITNENYLRQFDYIEGGVGIGNGGEIESGPCWSRLPSCWALLWNDQFASRANNVLLALDWSGFKFDDMSSFARMDFQTRSNTLKNLYQYFTSRNFGFLLPLMATLNNDNGGCIGPKKGFYSASNDYTCRDENAINSILRK